MEESSQRELAVILHADVVGSTLLVQKNESVAHDRIRDAFRRFSVTIDAYNGVTHELRGVNSDNRSALRAIHPRFDPLQRGAHSQYTRLIKGSTNYL